MERERYLSRLMVCTRFDCLMFDVVVLRIFITTDDATHIGAFKFEVCEVESDSVLRRCHDFPNAVLVRGVQVGEGWRRDGAVDPFENPATGICEVFTA